MFRLYRKVKPVHTTRRPPGRRYIHRTIRPSTTRPSAWQIALPVALGAAVTSYALSILNTSSPTDHEAIFARWNFPNVQWKYSPKLSSGEALGALEADWAYSTGIEARTTTAIKLLFAWFDAHRIDAHQNKVHFDDLEVLAALAACQIAKREFVTMETSKLMNPNHDPISRHVDNIEKEMWDRIRKQQPFPNLGDVNEAISEVKMACVAAIFVKIMHDRCDIKDLVKVVPVDTPEKQERMEEIVMACSYWKMTSPAERILTCEMMGLAAAFSDQKEIWKEAGDIGFFPFADKRLRYLEGYMGLVFHFIRLTRQEIQKEMVEIVTK